MTSDPTSTLAQFFFAQTPDIDLADEVGGLIAAFGATGMPQVRWDHNDVALLDFGPLRITLAFATGLRNGHPACLTVAAGDAPGASHSLKTSRHDMICKTITTRLSRKYAPDSSQWHVLPTVVTVDLINRVTDAVACGDEEIVAGLRSTLGQNASIAVTPRRKPSATEVIMTLRSGASTAICRLRRLSHPVSVPERARHV